MSVTWGCGVLSWGTSWQSVGAHLASLVINAPLALLAAWSCGQIATRHHLRRRPWMALGLLLGVLGMAITSIYANTTDRWRLGAVDSEPAEPTG